MYLTNAVARPKLGERDRPVLEFEALALQWEALARNKFASAENEADPMGRRLIEHGAMCYFNCAEELRAAIPTSSLPPS